MGDLNKLSNPFSKNTKQSLLVFGAIFIFLAVPLTVFLSLQGKPLLNKSSAATTFEQTACKTNRDPSGQSQCGNSVGNPDDYYFCDRWSGGFCDDFRTKQTTAHTHFPAAGDPYSVDFMSTTGTYYFPQQLDCCTNGGPPEPESFTANEHFMEQEADGNFGNAVIRLHQPFDFAGRTGHIHFDADLKTAARRYIRLTLSPNLTKRGSDDRSGTTGGSSSTYPPTGLDVWFQGGSIGVTENKNGTCGVDYCFKSTANVDGGYTGHDNVRDHIDVYVSRTHLKVIVNNAPQADIDIPDIGFDRSYVYFQQASYNPCKDGPVDGGVWPNSTLDQCSKEAQLFHWDNFAFDGPVLPTNSLTPSGSEDVVFNAYSVSQGVSWEPGYKPGQVGDCKVKGVNASPVGESGWGQWTTWVARLPANTPVSVPDITCNYTWGTDSGVSPVQGLEIVQASSGGVTNPPSSPNTPSQPLTPPPPPPSEPPPAVVPPPSSPPPSSPPPTVAPPVASPPQVSPPPPNSGGSTSKLGDLNSDGRVDIYDLSVLLSQWNGGGSGDLNSSGRVDIYDLSILLSKWGT